MSLMESLLYGLVSGFAEFLPVSSQAHQAILMQMFGDGSREPVRDILVHLAVLLSLFSGCRAMFAHLSREQAIAARSRRSHVYELKGLYDLRLVKTAALPLLAGLLLYIAASRLESSPVYVSVFLVINGIILIIPEYMRHGNKESRSMTGLDGILIGLSGALSALPGISRVGASTAVAVARGADKQHALNWAMLLSVPALVLFAGFDALNLITHGFGAVSFPIIAGYVLSAAAAYCGGYFGIVFMRFLTVRIGFAGFAYYSWGAALFSFILYLIT